MLRLAGIGQSAPSNPAPAPPPASAAASGPAAAQPEMSLAAPAPSDDEMSLAPAADDEMSPVAASDDGAAPAAGSEDTGMSVAPDDADGMSLAPATDDEMSLAAGPDDNAASAADDAEMSVAPDAPSDDAEMSVVPAPDDGMSLGTVDNAAVPLAAAAAASPDAAAEDGMSLAASGASDDDRAARLDLAQQGVHGAGTGSAADVNLVAETLADEMPLAELQQLQQAGISVAVTHGAVTSYMTELQGQTPRGYGTGGDWSNRPGTYKEGTKEVVIAAQDGADGSPAMPGKALSTSDDVMLHEAAHALNRTGSDGLRSDDEDFKAAYEADAKQGKLADAYYHQAGQDGADSSAGRDEAFAESNAMYLANPAKLKQDYPNLYAYWQKNLDATR